MTPDELQGALHEALANVFNADGRMVSRWVLVADLVDSEGDRNSLAYGSDGLSSWEAMGLLKWASISAERTTWTEMVDDGTEDSE